MKTFFRMSIQEIVMLTIIVLLGGSLVLQARMNSQSNSQLAGIRNANTMITNAHLETHAEIRLLKAVQHDQHLIQKGQGRLIKKLTAGQKDTMQIIKTILRQ